MMISDNAHSTVNGHRLRERICSVVPNPMWSSWMPTASPTSAASRAITALQFADWAAETGASIDDEECMSYPYSMTATVRRCGRDDSTRRQRPAVPSGPAGYPGHAWSLSAAEPSPVRR